MEYGVRRIFKIPVKVNRREIYIYSGYKGLNKPSEEVDAIIDECLEELEQLSEPKASLFVSPITWESPSSFSIGNLNIYSETLGKNLADCKSAVLVGATLSASVDLLLHRYSKLAITKSILMQATAAAYIEAYLNAIEDVLKSELNPEGYTLRPRFSPGFGDFGTEYQEDFLEAVNAKRYLGVSLANDSAMMTPSKSVTAVMGICKL